LGVEWEGRGISGAGAQGGITAVDPPAEFRLYPNHPNPFNAITLLSFQLPVAGHVTLQVFDLQGRLVETLIDGWRDAGSHSVVFDGSNLSSGLYLYRITAGSFDATGKMVLLK